MKSPLTNRLRKQTPINKTAITYMTANKLNFTYMKKITTILAIFLVVLSCSKNDEATPIPAKTTTIYAAGSGFATSGKQVAKYWENGVAKDITNGVFNASLSSIAVASNGDVYALGIEWNATVPIPKYWKNGVPTILPTTHPDISSQTTSRTTDIAISGNDVYVSGNVKLDNDNYLATYWKNGVENYLSSPNDDSYTTAIAVVNNEVYVTGYEFNGTIRKSLIWINGVVNDVTTGTSDSYISGIVLVGTKIYLSGNETIAGERFAVYWVKDTAVAGSSFVAYNLSGDKGIAQAITALGTDVYISGTESISTKYWKIDASGNKTVTILTNSGGDCDANNIFAYENDIYTKTFEDGIGTKYWKNNTQITSIPTLTDNRINGIFVTSK